MYTRRTLDGRTKTMTTLHYHRHTDSWYRGGACQECRETGNAFRHGLNHECQSIYYYPLATDQTDEKGAFYA